MIKKDFNAETEGLKKKFNDMDSDANNLTHRLTHAIHEWIKEKELFFLFGENPKVIGNVPDDLDTFYEWKIIPRGKKKYFLIYIKSYRRTGITGYLYLQGTNEKTDKSELDHTEDISLGGLIKLAENFKNLQKTLREFN